MYQGNSCQHLHNLHDGLHLDIYLRKVGWTYNARKVKNARTTLSPYKVVAIMATLRIEVKEYGRFKD